MRPRNLSHDKMMQVTHGPPAGHTRALRCVQLAGVLSVLGFIAFVVSLSVAKGNETVTGIATVFYLIGMLLFFLCTLSAYFASQKRNTNGLFSNTNAAIAFAGISLVWIIVSFSFMVADLVSPECENNVFPVLWCTPGEPQRALPLVIQDIIIICIISLFLIAGLKLRKLNSTRKLEVLRANLTTVDGGELGEIQPEQDEGDGVPLPQ